MILTFASAIMFSLGVYSSWLAQPAAARPEALTELGEYLGGLLIIGALAMLGWQLGSALELGTKIRF